MFKFKKLMFETMLLFIFKKSVQYYTLLLLRSQEYSEYIMLYNYIKEYK